MKFSQKKKTQGMRSCFFFHVLAKLIPLHRVEEQEKESGIILQMYYMVQI